MKFRTLFLIIRLFAPTAMGLTALSFLLPDGSTATVLRTIGGVLLVAMGVFGAVKGLQMESGNFLPMRCPFCDRMGTAGRGTFRVGWWLRCDTCGIVKPRGLLGLKYEKQAIEEYEEHEESAEDTLEPTVLSTPQVIISCLFCCFTAVVTVFMGYGVAVSAVRIARLADAVPVEATIRDYRQEVDLSGRTARWNVTVRCSYTFRGETYELKTHRLSVWQSDRDELRLRRKLQLAHESRQNVQAFVDPENPTLFVFSTAVSWPRFLVVGIFPLAFGFVTIALARGLHARFREGPSTGVPASKVPAISRR